MASVTGRVFCCNRNAVEIGSDCESPHLFTATNLQSVLKGCQFTAPEFPTLKNGVVHTPNNDDDSERIVESIAISLMLPDYSP